MYGAGNAAAMPIRKPSLDGDNVLMVSQSFCLRLKVFMSSLSSLTVAKKCACRHPRLGDASNDGRDPWVRLQTIKLYPGGALCCETDHPRDACEVIGVGHFPFRHFRSTHGQV